MKQLTQSNVAPGNCWQTAVACVLDLEPAALPDQNRFEKLNAQGEFIRWGSFNNALNAYLRKHHGLIYSQIDWHVFSVLRMGEPGLHFLIGPTVRTEHSGSLHVVVARYGEMIGDPHPSRAGLTIVKAWGLLCPFPEEWAEQWNRIPCVCPACETEARTA